MSDFQGFQEWLNAHRILNLSIDKETITFTLGEPTSYLCVVNDSPEAYLLSYCDEGMDRGFYITGKFFLLGTFSVF